MADDNKPMKYMRYAIGEIALVVIGILIAVSINNWNQRNNNETKITIILKEIQSDILIDLEASNLIIDYQIFTDSISKNIFNNKYTPEDLRNGNFQFIGYNYRDFKTTSNGFDNLKDNIDDVPEKYKHLLPEIKNLYVTTKTTIDVYNDKMRSTVYKNIDDESNHNWFQDHLKGKENNERIEYYINDRRYKNLVARYMLYRNNIFRISNEYRIKAIDLYLKINEVTNSENTVPEIVNYKNKSSNDYVGTYKLRETVNPEGRWDAILNIIERNEQLVIISSEDESELILLSYNKNIFFLDKFYGIIVFDKPKKEQLYISNGANYFAIYERIDSIELTIK